MSNQSKTKVTIAPETSVVRLGLSWKSCNDSGGTVKYDHDKMMRNGGQCLCCGEATSVTFEPGDTLIMYIKEGKLLRIDVNVRTYILDYPEIKRIAPVEKERDNAISQSLI